jgi:hypothetical protein
MDSVCKLCTSLRLVTASVCVAFNIARQEDELFHFMHEGTHEGPTCDEALFIPGCQFLGMYTQNGGFGLHIGDFVSTGLTAPRCLASCDNCKFTVPPGSRPWAATGLVYIYTNTSTRIANAEYRIDRSAGQPVSVDQLARNVQLYLDRGVAVWWGTNASLGTAWPLSSAEADGIPFMKLEDPFPQQTMQVCHVCSWTCQRRCPLLGPFCVLSILLHAVERQYMLVMSCCKGQMVRICTQCVVSSLAYLLNHSCSIYIGDRSSIGADATTCFCQEKWAEHRSSLWYCHCMCFGTAYCGRHCHCSAMASQEAPIFWIPQELQFLCKQGVQVRKRYGHRVVQRGDHFRAWLCLGMQLLLILVHSKQQYGIVQACLCMMRRMCFYGLCLQVSVTGLQGIRLTLLRTVLSFLPW